MKKSMRILARALAVTLLLVQTSGLNVFAAELPVVDGDVITATITYENGLVIEKEPVAPEGYLLTMTVDHVETAIAPGSYNGNVVITVTEQVTDQSGEEVPQLSRYVKRGLEAYRAGLYITPDGVISSRSVLDCIVGGSYDGSSIDGISTTAESSGFSAIIIENLDGVDRTGVVESGEPLYYTISGAEINMLSDSDGSDVSDFTGYGAAVSAYGDVNLTVEDTDIHTTGVAKVGLYADRGADILFKSGSITVEGGEIYDSYENTANQNLMVMPPWVLGVSGTARGSNLVGFYSTTTFLDSEITAADWGAVSTDYNNDVVLTVINSDLTTTSGDGYGAYCNAGSYEYFYGANIDNVTYGVIMTKGEVTFGSSEGVDSFDIVNCLGETVFSDVVSSIGGRPSVVNAVFGALIHQNRESDNSIWVEDGAVLNTKHAAFLVKASNARVYVDNAVINVEDGVILQMMDNDDSSVGMQEGKQQVFNTTFSEDAGYPGIDNDNIYGAQHETQSVGAEFTNVTLDGDIYNATGYVDAAKYLEVTLGKNAVLNGNITSTSAIHVQTDGKGNYILDENGGVIQATAFTSSEYYNLGHVVNRPFYNGYNDVYVTLEDGAVWNVEGACLLSSLSIGAGCEVNLPKGHVALVDGVEVSLTAGETYEGVISIAEKETDSEQTVTPVPGVTSTYTVQSGDTLWGIAKNLLGSGYRWNELYTANMDTIKNPNMIFAGQVLILP